MLVTAHIKTSKSDETFEGVKKGWRCMDDDDDVVGTSRFTHTFEGKAGER